MQKLIKYRKFLDDYAKTVDRQKVFGYNTNTDRR